MHSTRDLPSTPSCAHPLRSFYRKEEFSFLLFLASRGILLHYKNWEDHRNLFCYRRITCFGRQEHCNLLPTLPPYTHLHTHTGALLVWEGTAPFHSISTKTGEVQDVGMAVRRGTLSAFWPPALPTCNLLVSHFPTPTPALDLLQCPPLPGTCLWAAGCLLPGFTAYYTTALVPPSRTAMVGLKNMQQCHC